MDALNEYDKAVLARAKILIVDDEYYTRKVIRTLLLAIGCTRIHKAVDGASGLKEIRAFAPDLVLLDWEMPGIDGAEFVRRVRSPHSFPLPNVPIIMLTGHGKRSRVFEAMRLGVHEFLLKPVSSAALRARILSVLGKPRAIGRRGDYYGPEPRGIATGGPGLGDYGSEGARAVDRSTVHMVFVD